MKHTDTLRPFSASPRGAVRPFEVMEVFRDAAVLEAQGRSIVHLSLGQPGARVPEVMAYVAEHLARLPLGYTDARGMPALRQRISQHYAQHYSTDIAPERIFITVGSSSAFSLALLAGFEAGARIGLARPCYPAYPNMLHALGMETVWIETSEADGFQPTPEALAAAGRLDGLVIASPANPTGSIIDAPAMAALCAYCDAHGIRLISDEIYHHVTYSGARAVSALAHSSQAIVVNSFSKYYLLPGWRLGWAVVPEAMTRAYECLLQSFYVSPPAISQYAALETFNHLDALDAVVAGYGANRDRLASCLRRLGFSGARHAQGAFYLYANATALGMHSRDLCRAMLHEAGVCAVPGTDFDTIHGGDYVRFSYCGSADAVAEACRRLEAWGGAGR